jgi:hypothetical protein
MAYVKFQVNSVAGLTEGSYATLTGKNGFKSVIGSIPVLINAVSVTDVTGSYAGNVQLTVSNLNSLHDPNFNKHILTVNDNTFSGIKGLDYISIPIEEKSNTGAPYGFVGYNPIETRFSSNVLTYNLQSNTIKIENKAASGSELYSVLPSTPFYAYLTQIIDTRYFSNNIAYIEGSRIKVSRTSNVDTVSGLYTHNLGVTPRDKIFITFYVDEIEQSQATFTWAGGSNVTYTVAGTEKLLRTDTEFYTVPAIEPGDNVYILADNIYSVAQTSYSGGHTLYNAAFTANYFFQIQTTPALKANLTAATIINISKDIQGFIGNVNTAANTFTLDYDAIASPGQFNLANNKLYSLNGSLTFKRITLGTDKIIRDAPTGANIVRARNVNRAGRKSPYVTRTSYINTLPIQKVTGLTITESLYQDTNQGVLVRAEISFNHINDQDVVQYEIAYRLSGVDQTDLVNFNTVLVPAVGVDSLGKIRYTINNIDRGRTSAINSIIVKVTPITGANLRGVAAELTQSIAGKTAAPQNVTNIAGGQQGENLLLVWKVPTNADGTVVDLDLNEIEIRRISGTIASSLYLERWITATLIAKVATPASSYFSAITEYGTHTYLFRTKDTSGNYSSDIVALVVTTTRPNNVQTYKAWSEDDPSTNFVTGVTNENSTEYNYPSFANSNTGGIAYSYTSRVDNANGTSTGFTLLVGSPTDLTLASNGRYQTQLRNVFSSISGTILTTFSGTQTISTTFNELRTTIVSGVSETISLANVLVDTDWGGLGTLLGHNNVNAATPYYDANNRTLVSGDTSGNVFGIWNAGQFANDISNANTFALIAGIINANAVALGQTFWANGIPTGGNTLPNLISNATSYLLVNFTQFADPGGSITFAGETDVITTNTEIRYANSQALIYFANGNVNVSAFENSSVNDGWRPYSAVEQTFQYFQMKYTVTNQNPTAAAYLLDRLNYTLDLKLKEFNTIVHVSSYPYFVNYSSAGFIRTPSRISVMPIANAALVGTVVDYGVAGANIAVFSTVSGTANTNVDVIFEARGI